VRVAVPVPLTARVRVAVGVKLIARVAVGDIVIVAIAIAIINGKNLIYYDDIFFGQL
jgi:hypothetical protein